MQWFLPLESGGELGGGGVLKTRRERRKFPLALPGRWDDITLEVGKTHLAFGSEVTHGFNALLQIGYYKINKGISPDGGT